MHVLFIEPSFPRNQRMHVRGLAAAGARVTAIGEAPRQAIDPELASWLHGYEQIGSVVDTPALIELVRQVQAREPVDRLEATVEAHIQPAADAREACEIPGTSARTAFLCRDKPAMKEALREAGVPCARSIGATSAEEARDFAREVGYPLILKPRDGAGAAGTYMAEDGESLEKALQACGLAGGAPTAVEEYIEGHEAFYDTLCVDGEVVHDFITHYYPGVLEAMRTRWVSPQILTTNRLSSPDYGEIKELGKKVIEVLGIGTSATHMEWFYGPKGLKFSEIGCRPPGVRVWDIYSEANDFDTYEEWAKLIVAGRTETVASRNYSAGMIALRPDRDGEIAGYSGWEEIQERFAPFLIDAHMPPPGTPTQSVEGGYMANAWVRVKHPDYDECRRILDAIGETVQVSAR